MKQKYEGKDLQGLVDLGREQGYLTFDQVNDFLPQDVASPTDLRAALESFEDMDIKVLEEVPTEAPKPKPRSRPRKSPKRLPKPRRRRPIRSANRRTRSASISRRWATSSSSRASRKSRLPSGSKPARTRSKRRSSSSPVTLDFMIRVGERVESRRGRPARHLRGSTRSSDDPDEEKRSRSRRSAAQAALLVTKKLTELREQARGDRGGARATSPARGASPSSTRSYARLKERVKEELAAMQLSRRVDGSGYRRDAPSARRVSAVRSA